MNIKKKLAALAVIGAVVAGGLSVAQSASAAEMTGETLTITPTSGNVNTDVYFLNSIGASAAAPVGFRALGGTFAYQGGVEMGSVSNSRTTAMASTAGTNGLDGNVPVYMDRSISPTNNYVSNKLLNATLVPLATGPFELRFYYFASSTAPDRTTDPYIKLDMTYDATTGAWSVLTPITATTTSLAAGATGSDVTLSATVKKPDNTTATDATGDVVFKEGATTVATVPVASGEAGASLTGVADGEHIYTAEFVPTGTVYSGSVSGSATVFVGAQSMPATIDVTIPNNVGFLTLTGVPTSVSLGTAVLNGETLDASGVVTAVVTDSRQLDYPAWSLTGQVTDFAATGGLVLDGKYLGWTPSITSGPSNSAAGSAVLPAPATTSGIKAISQFATGAPSAESDVTNVSAALLLKAPRDTVAGDYTATLTVTLI